MPDDRLMPSRPVPALTDEERALARAALRGISPAKLAQFALLLRHPGYELVREILPITLEEIRKRAEEDSRHG